MLNNKNTIEIKCKTDGFEDATEEVEALADAFNEFPPQVTIRNCRDCEINVYPSQTKIISTNDDENDCDVDVG